MALVQPFDPRLSFYDDIHITQIKFTQTASTLVSKRFDPPDANEDWIPLWLTASDSSVIDNTGAGDIIEACYHDTISTILVPLSRGAGQTDTGYGTFSDDGLNLKGSIWTNDFATVSSDSLGQLSNENLSPVFNLAHLRLRKRRTGENWLGLVVFFKTSGAIGTRNWQLKLIYYRIPHTVTELQEFQRRPTVEEIEE